MWPSLYSPCGQRFGLRQQLDQRGFSGAVHSHQRNPVAALDHEIDVAKHFLLAVGFRHPDELGDDPARGLGLRKGEVNGLFFLRQLDALDLLQFLDPALHLLGLGRLVAEAVDEDFQLLDALALVAIGGFELLQALCLRVQILRVIAVVKMNALVPDLDNLVDGHVEKIAVVRDQHKSVGIVAEIFLQPVAGFEIKMVGGLVQQQQVGLLQQQFDQRDAHLPAAGKFFGLPGPVFFSETQAPQAPCRPAPRWRIRREW